MPRWRSSSPATNVSNAAPALCHLACHSPRRKIDRSGFRDRGFLGSAGISPAALRPAPLQSRLGYLPKAVSAGPAIPRGRRSGRPSSGCAQAACEMAGVRAGYVRCPVRQRHSRSVHRRLRAASGMVSRGLVTTSITVSRDHHVTNDAMLSSVVPIERSHGVHSTGLHRGVPDPMAHRRGLRSFGRANLATSSN
jgi:hypothetical protein